MVSLVVGLVEQGRVPVGNGSRRVVVSAPPLVRTIGTADICGNASPDGLGACAGSRLRGRHTFEFDLDLCGVRHAAVDVPDPPSRGGLVGTGWLDNIRGEVAGRVSGARIEQL